MTTCCPVTCIPVFVIQNEAIIEDQFPAFPVFCETSLTKVRLIFDHNTHTHPGDTMASSNTIPNLSNLDARCCENH